MEGYVKGSDRSIVIISALPRKKRICFFIGNLSHSGGTERVLSIIANGLSDRGYEISIISLWGNEPSFFQFVPSIRIHWIEAGKRKTIPQNLRAIRTVLRQEKPDFLIDVDIILCFYSVLLRHEVSYMRWYSWEHFNYYYQFSQNHNLRKVARRIVARYSDRMIVLTKADAGYYQQNLKLHCALSQIYNPTPYEDKPPKCMEKKTIFAAGRLTSVKGFDRLLKSWALLEKKYPEWEVIVAGEGEDREELEGEKKKLGIERCQFIGIIDNIEKYYKMSAIYVLPSRCEGLGMVLLEAMSYGLPVVSYSINAGPDEVIDDGEDGFLVKDDDIKGFAEKMEILMKDESLRRQMGINAQQAMKRFSSNCILDTWERILR